MKFQFNFSSFNDLFSSFKTPTAEIRPLLTHTNLRVQKRATSHGHEFHLRFSTFGNISYFRLEERELTVLADALERIKGPTK
jgi:hypothetical protein